MPRWQTQARLFGARPVRILTPKSAAEVSAAVGEATERELAVRMVGGGTAAGPVAVCNGIMLRPTALTQLTWIDPEVIRVGAGVTVSTLVAELRRRGRAIAGIAGPADATVAGSVSTAGYGPHEPLAASVQSLEMVAADGRVRLVVADEPWGRAAVGGLGGFGIITAVEVRTSAAYNDIVTTDVLAFEEALAGWREWADDAAWMQWLWVPGAERVLVRRGTREPAVAAGADAVRASMLPAAHEARWRRRAGLAVPLLLPRLNRNAVVGAAAQSPTSVAWSAGVHRDTARELATTWTVPIDQALPALRMLREALRTTAQSTTTALSVRTIDADTGLLSPFYQRRSALISARVRLPAPFERYFTAVAAALAPFDARPHWGSYVPEAENSPMAGHPGGAAAREVRDQIDPLGLFDSAAVARLLRT